MNLGVQIVSIEVLLYAAISREQRQEIIAYLSADEHNNLDLNMLRKVLRKDYESAALPLSYEPPTTMKIPRPLPCFNTVVASAYPYFKERDYFDTALNSSARILLCKHSRAYFISASFSARAENQAPCHSHLD